jgi:two-component system sensor histidine kinase MtrB
VGWFVSRQVLRPVRTMANTAEEIADGDLSARLDALGDPELEPLQRSFNHMADTVQEQIERERRFASDVSHELRTPLTAMMASVQIARRRVSDPVAVERALDDLDERGEAFRDLVLDLLEISRIDAGVADMVREPVVVEDLVRAVLAVNGDEDVPVCVEPGTATEVQGDKRRLGQVLQNLLENADRYGGGATQVGIASQDGMVVITVDDDGPGVPDHEKTHIFNRFARGRTATGSSEGSGLGLALVSEHVKLHRGSISVGASPSGGARFRVALPVDPGDPPPSVRSTR